MECGRTNTAIDQSTREGQYESLMTQPSNIECWTGQWSTLGDEYYHFQYLGPYSTCYHRPCFPMLMVSVLFLCSLLRTY